MVKKLGNSRIHPDRLGCGGHGMGRDIYGRYPGSTANGDAGSRPCMYGRVSCAPPCQNESTEVAPKMTTVIDVKMQYPAPPHDALRAPPMCGPVGCAPPPPIPVAVPMWKFIVPWPPFVYYLPVE